MQVTRFNEFQAKENMESDLLALLESVVKLVNGSEGIISCQLLQHTETKGHFMVIEVWESVQAHQAAVKNIPPELLQKAMPLLAAPPKGAYWQEP